MNSRRTTLPIPSERVEELRRSLSPRYGCELWDGARETGNGERILVVRVPGIEPDLVNDLEASVEYVAPGDLQGVRTLLLLGRERNLTVASQPLKDLMAARVQADKRMCAAVRPHLRAPLVHRAQEDPHKLPRLMVPLPRRHVAELDDVDLDRLADLLAPHLDDPEWQKVRCVYLVAAEDDVRIDADLFFQDITQRCADLAAQRKEAARAAQQQAAQEGQQQDAGDEGAVIEGEDTPDAGAQGAAQSAAQAAPQDRDAVDSRQTPGANVALAYAEARQAPPAASREPQVPNAVSTPATARTSPRSPDARWTPGRVSEGERRALLEELERRYGRSTGIAYAPLRQMPANATWEAEARSEVLAAVDALGPLGTAHPAQPLAGGSTAPAVPAGPAVPPLPVPALAVESAPADTSPTPAPLMPVASTPEGVRPSHPIAGASLAQAAHDDVAAEPTLMGHGLAAATGPATSQSLAQLHAASQQMAGTPGSQEGARLGSIPEALRAHLVACGFDVAVEPAVPGHVIDLAAERAQGYPQRLIVRLPQRLTMEVAEAVVQSSRALDVDLALVVCSEADAEARKRLIATKAKWVSPLDVPHLAL